ncbi:hypothetical protein L0222_09555 [bacterium]|nr:hypothetical protein [bacterium]MCI0606014.1 hypothetical protein [bacterium]
MFLVGGPPFSGTTLLAFLLNQGNLICLDEPDFHNPEQSHRGIPFLKTLFPDKTFPEDPRKPLTYEETVSLVRECEKAMSPINLGIKTCNDVFIGHARIYKQLKYPVIAIIRDIRDALVNPLPDWLTENKMSRLYRMIWENLSMFDLVIRYEDLIRFPENTMIQISRILGSPLEVRESWNPNLVHGPMLKLQRHHQLKRGTISKDRIGIWKDCGKSFMEETHETALIMGYPKTAL